MKFKKSVAWLFGLLSGYFLLAWIMTPVSFLIYYYVYNTAPKSPIGEYSVRISNHGDIFYVTPVQAMLTSEFFLAAILGCILFPIFCIFIYRTRKKRC